MSPSAPQRGPRALGNVLSDLFAQRGLAQVATDRQWQQLWSEIAGPAVARHSRVAGLRGAVLEIVVDSSVLLQELATFRRAELLGALQAKMPPSHLRQLRFRVGAI